MSTEKAKNVAEQKADQDNTAKVDKDKLVPLTDDQLEKVVGGTTMAFKTTLKANE